MKPRTSATGWIITALAIAFMILVHWCDAANAPVIAPYMDWTAEFIYRIWPFLYGFPNIDPMWLSSAVIGFAFFALLGILSIIFDPSPNSSERIERRLAKNSKRRQKREERNDYAE